MSYLSGAAKKVKEIFGDKPADGKVPAAKPAEAVAQPPATAGAAAGSTPSAAGASLPADGPSDTPKTSPVASTTPPVTSEKSPVSPTEPSVAAKQSPDGPAKSPGPGKDSPTPAVKSSGPTKIAPDASVNLPPTNAESSATFFIPREDVKLQPPTIAVTDPASAVVSLPAEKVKAAPAQTLPASPPLPAGEGRGEGEKPLGSVASTNAKAPTPSPSPQPSPSEGEGARLAANVSTPDPATSTAPKSKPSPAPADLPKPATWKNLPATEPWCPPVIAAHAPELRKVAAADAVASERVLPGWRAAGASRRGRMHANGGTHREDSLAFDAHDRATVLCVSDGAGSCQHSRIGSHVAALRVVEFLLAATEKVDSAVAADATKLKEHLSSKVTEAVLSATDALLDLAKKSGCSPKDFRCTLLTALHYRGEQHELLLTNQIGDGAICLLRKDQSTARLGASDSGTHSGEVSCFVPDDCARVKAKAVDVISDVAALECVLLCSDGIEDPFYPLEKQAAGIFRQFYKGVDQPLKDFKAQLPQAAPLLQESAAEGLAQWLEFEKRGENDDRTVAVLHRQPVNVSW